MKSSSGTYGKRIMRGFLIYCATLIFSAGLISIWLMAFRAYGVTGLDHMIEFLGVILCGHILMGFVVGCAYVVKYVDPPGSGWIR